MDDAAYLALILLAETGRSGEGRSSSSVFFRRDRSLRGRNDRTLEAEKNAGIVEPGSPARRQSFGRRRARGGVRSSVVSGLSQC
jgi:hypothetical protein